jgi:hypothetical protein
MAKSTLLIEERLAAIEERLDKIEGKSGSDWQPLSALVTHKDNPYSRWALINQMRAVINAAIDEPTPNLLREGVHFINTTGRYYVRPLPYLKAVGVVSE